MNSAHAKHQSPFQQWFEQHKDVETGKTTLVQQIEFAQTVYNQANNNTHSVIHNTPPSPQQVACALEQTPLQQQQLVTWKGLHVGWIQKVFFQSPFLCQLRAMGCELWIVRKVCVTELIRRAVVLAKHNDNANQDNASSLVLTGTFLDHLDAVQELLEGTTTIQNNNNYNTPLIAKPTLFVSYTGAYTLDALVDVLGQLNDDDYIWMDLFCVDQFTWMGKGKSEELRAFKQGFVDSLQGAIHDINKVALVLKEWDNAMSTLEQMWVLWEVFNAAEADAELTVLLPRAQATHFCTQCLECDAQFEQIQTSLSRIDAHRAQAQDIMDRALIFERMQRVGLEKVNTMVIAKMRELLLTLGQRHLAQLRQRQQSQNDDDSVVVTPTFLNNLGMLYKVQGRLDEAEPLLREALDKCQCQFGDQNEQTLKCFNHLGRLLQDQGKLPEAQEYYQFALEGRRVQLGRTHRDTLKSVNNLGTVLQDQGQLEEAEPLLREALEGCRWTFGQDHHHTLAAFNNLGRLLQEQGNLSEAETLLRQALNGKRRQLGRHHTDTLLSLNNLGSLLYKQGRLDEARPLFCQALDGYRQQLGHFHPDTLVSTHNLALLYIKLGGAHCFQHAKDLLAKELAGWRALNHPHEHHAQSALEYVREKLLGFGNVVDNHHDETKQHHQATTHSTTTKDAAAATVGVTQH